MTWILLIDAIGLVIILAGLGCLFVTAVHALSARLQQEKAFVGSLFLLTLYEHAELRAYTWWVRGKICIFLGLGICAVASAFLVLLVLT